MANSDGKLGLVIVGSGNMAATHASHWSKIPEIELVGIASKDRQSAAALVGADRAEAFDSLDDAVAKLGERAAIVDVCTPTPTHAAIAIQALQAGKHVFLEKPMARTLAQCDAIAAAARSSRTVFMVGQVVRYFPQYRDAKERVTAGAVGTPAAVRAARLAGPPGGGWRNWYADASQSGGVVLDMIIHDFDWLRWAFGPVDRVFAKGLYAETEKSQKLDYALCTLHHASGVLSHVTGSWAHTGGFRTTFEICGDLGMIEHDSAASPALTIAQRRSESAASGVIVPESPMSATDDPYYRELRHFTDCILSGKQPDVGIDDARAAVEIALACLQSIESGEPVTIA